MAKRTLKNHNSNSGQGFFQNIYIPSSYSGLRNLSAWCKYDPQKGFFSLLQVPSKVRILVLSGSQFGDGRGGQTSGATLHRKERKRNSESFFGIRCCKIYFSQSKHNNTFLILWKGRNLLYVVNCTVGGGRGE